MAAQKQEKYDVGIVGVGVGANYGSVLTYYSLYKTVESFGNKVLMVSKIGASANDPELLNNHAADFARRHYNLSKLYSQKTVQELNQIADTFVIGSDQVWNYGISQHFGKAFYLDFAADDKRKISYAASFGHEKDFSPAEEVPKISALMNRFNAISVREDSGVRILRDIYQIPGRQVAEPIFLTDTKEYLRLASESKRDVSEPYLLAYILDPTPEKNAAIAHVAQRLSLKIRIILDAWQHLFQENKKKIDIEGAVVEEGIDTYDFLKLYSNCSYAVTDSFHGTAFALKFEKPFASIGNRRRGVSRFDSMFRLIGHKERFTLNAENIIKREEDFLRPLDYAPITAALEAHVADSKAWLKASLKKPVRDTVANGGLTVSRSGWLPRLDLGRAARVAGKIAAVLKQRATQQKIRLEKPAFTASSTVWSVDAMPRATRLRITTPGVPARGHLAWTDLPEPLRAGAAYKLTLDWVLRTGAGSVNLHLRNPASGEYRVIGTVVVGKAVNSPRSDTISFVVPKDGFSQIMLGAMHFTGDAAGADVTAIALQSIRPEDVVPNAAPIAAGAQKKDAATVVKELSQGDDLRFIDTYAQHRISRSVANARSLLMYYSHGFEKGLSRTTSFRAGFGNLSMPPLSKEMNKWLAKGRDPKDSFFQIAASVMNVYFERHRLLGVDVSHFWKLFDAPVQEEIRKADPRLGGALAASVLREAEPGSLPDRGFADVVFSRRSVREFTAAPVADADIRRATQIAMQAPSVCNRQPVRIHQFDDTDTIRAVLELQGGFRGYALPPKLLLVTSDLSAFVAAVERNQAYIDGGLFMMLMLLGLEEVGLGSCSLNTAMNHEREEAARKLLNIPKGEVFISFIAVGHFNPEVMVPRSTRIPVEEVLCHHGKAKAGV